MRYRATCHSLLTTVRLLAFILLLTLVVGCNSRASPEPIITLGHPQNVVMQEGFNLPEEVSIPTAEKVEQPKLSVGCARSILVFSSIVYALDYSLTKQLQESIDPTILVAIQHFASAIFMAPTLPYRRVISDMRSIRIGIELGLWTAIAAMTTGYALQNNSPGKVSFIGGVSVLLPPLFDFLQKRLHLNKLPLEGPFCQFGAVIRRLRITLTGHSNSNSESSTYCSSSNINRSSRSSNIISNNIISSRCDSSGRRRGSKNMLIDKTTKSEKPRTANIEEVPTMYFPQPMLVAGAVQPAMPSLQHRSSGSSGSCNSKFGSGKYSVAAATTGATAATAASDASDASDATTLGYDQNVLLTSAQRVLQSAFVAPSLAVIGILWMEWGSMQERTPFSQFLLCLVPPFSFALCTWRSEQLSTELPYDTDIASAVVLMVVAVVSGLYSLIPTFTPTFTPAATFAAAGTDSSSSETISTILANLGQLGAGLGAEPVARSFIDATTTTINPGLSAATTTAAAVATATTNAAVVVSGSIGAAVSSFTCSGFARWKETLTMMAQDWKLSAVVLLSGLIAVGWTTVREQEALQVLSATEASVLLSSEPVFAALAGRIIVNSGETAGVECIPASVCILTGCIWKELMELFFNSSSSRNSSNGDRTGDVSTEEETSMTALGSTRSRAIKHSFDSNTRIFDTTNFEKRSVSNTDDEYNFESDDLDAEGRILKARKRNDAADVNCNRRSKYPQQGAPQYSNYEPHLHRQNYQNNRRQRQQCSSKEVPPAAATATAAAVIAEVETALSASLEEANAF